MISRIEANGFAGLPDGLYEFAELNRVHGQNGVGKTSLKRAITWGLTGCNENAKAAPTEYCAGNPCWVKIELADGTIIERRRHNNATTIVMNGAFVDTKDYWGGVLRMSPQLCCSILNPQTIFRLSENELRSIFLEAANATDLDAICEEKFPGCPKINWAEAKKARPLWAAHRKGLEENVARIEGQITGAATAEVERPQGDMADLSAKIEGLGARLRGLQEQATLHAAWQAHRAKPELPQCPGPLVPLEEMNAAHNAFLAAERAKDNARASWQLKAAALQELRKIKGGTCPTCRQPIGDDSISEAREILDRETTAAKDFFDEQDQAFRVAKTKLDGLHKRAEERAKWDRLSLESRPPDQPDPGAPGDTLTHTANELADLKSRYNAIATWEKNRAKMMELHEKNKEELAKVNAALRQALIAEAALNPKTGVEAEALRRLIGNFSGIADFEFVFSETLGNGNTRDIFSCRRKADEVDMADLSSGEKIKLAVEIAAILGSLVAPITKTMCIENGDLVDRLQPPKGWQLIIERVSQEPALTITTNRGKANG